MMQKRYNTHINSFVKRCGRLSNTQRESLKTLVSHKIDFQEGHCISECFPALKPLTIEIGFGMGDFLINYAKCVNQTRNILGIDIHLPGIARVLTHVEREQWLHVLVMAHDAVAVLEQMVLPSSVDEIFILFPDPWPKKRHHKRRFFSSYTRDLLESRLCPGARLVIATDDVAYAAWITEILKGSRLLKNVYEDSVFGYQIKHEPVFGTKYERKALDQGRSICEFLFAKSDEL